MKHTILVGAICAFLGSALSGLGWEGDDNPAIFFANDRARAPQASRMAPDRRSATASQSHAAALISHEVAKYAGERWIPEALRIARTESGFRCDAVNRSSGASGLGQMLSGTAERMEPGSSRYRRDCETGARLMGKYLASCIAYGATTDALARRCWLGGEGAITKRLNRRAEKYVASYSRLVAGARPVLVADSGWISLGSVSIFR